MTRVTTAYVVARIGVRQDELERDFNESNQHLKIQINQLKRQVNELTAKQLG